MKKSVFILFMCLMMVFAFAGCGGSSEEAAEEETAAADLTSRCTLKVASGKNSLKKLKGEKLRLLAPVLGVSYDDLRERERQRRIKRILSMAAAFAIFAGVLTGIRERDRELLEMARVFHVRPWRKLLMIDIPEVYPYFHSACRTALGLSWKSGIAAEVIGMPKGSIGEHLQQAKVYLDTPALFAWTVVIVLISLLCERLVLHGMDQGMKMLRRWKG